MTTAFVFDNGLFVELAARLARTNTFDKVLYYKHFQSPFPKMQYDVVGKGVEGIEMVREYSKYWDQVDTWIFPDVGNEDIQEHLRRDGQNVWGMGPSEWLELDRWKCRQWQVEQKLPTPETERVVGIDALRECLQRGEDLWVKISYYRGDMETWHHEKMWKSELKLAELRHSLGALEADMEFIVEKGVDGCEIGYDGWTVRGQFPTYTAFGYEVKDVGYIGKVTEYSQMPPALLKVNDKLKGVFESSGSTGFFSTEVRVTKNKRPYLIDPCMRCGSPPTEGTMELYDNFGDIIREGARGNLVVPSVKADYVAIAMIHCDEAIKNWVPVDIPKGVRDYVKIRQLAVIDGKHYFIPSDIPMKEIGAVVGLGSSVEEAIESCKEHAKEVDGSGLDIHLESFGKAQEVIAEGEKVGISF